MNRSVRVLVFGRSPIPGRAKTRLIPALGAEGAARLYTLLLEHALATATAAGLDRVTLWLDAVPAADVVVELAERYGAALQTQVAGDLGARMNAALETTLTAGVLPLLMGSDVPVLTTDALQQAAGSLRAGHDAVIAPAEDGGYGLIGVSRPLPTLFESMPWGTSGVLAETRRRCALSGIDMAEIGTVWDIDEPEDLARLSDVPGLADWRRRLGIDAVS